MKTVAALAFAAVLLVSCSADTAPAQESSDTPQARRATKALNIPESQGYAADIQDKSSSAFSDFREQRMNFVSRLQQRGRSDIIPVARSGDAPAVKPRIKNGQRCRSAA